MSGEFLRPSADVSESSALIVANPQMAALLTTATRVAASEGKVLITGESGVGKDLVARHIHARSRRSARPFIAVNCAALTDSLLESELFGHLKGSFTGAYRDKPGKLQAANRGTIFLDEVGEMSLRMQALLLRFLENGEIQPVGSDASRKVDVRIIAATNRDLTELVRSGQFREDLLYRLQVIHLHVPPLRERRADIRALKDDVGECSSAGPDVPENWLRGQFTITCTHGIVGAFFTLAPTEPPGIQHLSFRKLTSPIERMGAPTGAPAGVSCVQ